MILAGTWAARRLSWRYTGFSTASWCTFARSASRRGICSLEEIVRHFLLESEAPDITAACFGVPGPVRGGRLRLTNLPWILDSRELSTSLGIQHLFLINDLEANGYGIPELKLEQIFTLNQGDPAAVGNRGLVSADRAGGRRAGVERQDARADGLGRRALRFCRAQRAGSGVARLSDEEADGRVSWERVISGQGMTNIYRFLRDVKGMAEPAWLQARMAEEDPNAVIGEVGEQGRSELCSKTLEMFVSAYGAEAGNLVLKVLATGGMYLGGGIAPKILKTMRGGAFLQAFTDKGRLRDLLIQTPVHIILESRCALMGAAAFAEARAAEISGKSVRAASR